MRTVRIGKLKLPVVQLVSVIAVLGILVFMLYMAPLRLDDWAWGGNIGLDRLSSGFEGYNGRYAGDIVVILLTRIPALLRAIVETTVLVSIAFNAYLILRKSPTAFSVFLMAFSLMPLMIFTQTVTWAAGFANFVFSLAIMMYLLRVFLQVDGGAKQGALKSAYVLVIVFVGQLFLENITLYTICLCIVFTVRSIKNRSSRSFFVLALACSLGGALLMFSNSAYMSAFAGDGDSYKTIGVAGSGFLSTLKQWAKTYAYDIVPSWMSSCGPACILLALGGIGLSATKRSKMSCIAITVGVFILGACLYSIVDGEWFTMIERGVYIRALLYSMLYLYVLIVLMLFSKDRFKTLLIAFSQILIVGPLLLVNPIGPRCFLASYALWCLLAALMAKQAVNELIPLDELSMQHWRNRILLAIPFVLVFAVLCCSTVSQSTSWHIYDLRAQATEYAIENNLKTLELPEVPMSRFYCFGANVSNNNAYWLGNYKRFYGIPDDVELRFQLYSDWDGSRYGIDD